jgi:hypothetical protein
VTWSRMRDQNEPEIVRVLEAAGATVSKLNGTGVPDLLVGFGGVTYLLEVKRPDSAGGRAKPNMGGDGTLTEAQIKWVAKWRGAPASVVRTPDEALAAIGCWIEDKRTASPLYNGAPVASEWRRPATAADFPAKKRKGG